MLKKFLSLFLILILSASYALADTKTFTRRYGVRTMYGYTPTSSPYGAYTDCDPYIFTIGGEKYYMIRDNGGSYNRKSLLGCSEPKRSLFNPLERLNSDSDRQRLTPEELRRAKIRFVRVKSNGKLALHNRRMDYNLNNIAYIDLRRVRFSLSGTPMGSFDIYVKRESGSTRKVVAKVAAKSHYYVDRLF